MNLNPQKNAGITLIEVILVIAIISLLGVSSTSIGARFLVDNYLENKTNELVSLLQTAQINAISGKNDTNWGVTVANNQIIIFSGDSYATRNPEFDQFFRYPSSITISNQEIIFNKVEGSPNAPLSYTLTSNAGKISNVSINQLGVIDVN